MAEPPAKRPRLSTSAAYDNVPGIAEQRRTNELRLKSRFDAIYDKYDRDFTGIGDVIDLRTGEIVVDNGHLKRMRHERDLGVDVIGPKPKTKSRSTRKSKSRTEEELHSITAHDDHDELSSPPRRDVHEEDTEVPTIMPAEGQWARPEELNDPPAQPASASPIANSPADIASRVVTHAAPDGQQLNLLNPAHLARFTANIVQEVVQALQGHQPIQIGPSMHANPASLLTPPASERAGPIQPFASVWGEDGADTSDEDEDGEDNMSERRETTQLQGVRQRRPFTDEEDRKVLSMRNDQKSGWSVIATELGRSAHTVQKRYNNLSSKSVSTGKQRELQQPSVQRSKDKSRRATIQLPAQSAPMKTVKQPKALSTLATSATKRRTRLSLPTHTASIADRHGLGERTTRRSARLSGLPAPGNVEADDTENRHDEQRETARTLLVEKLRRSSESTTQVGESRPEEGLAQTSIRQSPDSRRERSKPTPHATVRVLARQPAHSNTEMNSVATLPAQAAERSRDRRFQVQSLATINATTAGNATPTDPRNRLRRVSQRLSQAGIPAPSDASENHLGTTAKAQNDASGEIAAKAQNAASGLTLKETTTRKTRLSTGGATAPMGKKPAATSTAAAPSEHLASTATTIDRAESAAIVSTRNNEDPSETHTRRRTSSRVTANAAAMPPSNFAAPPKPSAKTTQVGPSPRGRPRKSSQIVSPAPAAQTPTTATTTPAQPAQPRIKSSPRSPPTVLGPSPVSKTTPRVTVEQTPQDDLGSEDELGF